MWAWSTQHKNNRVSEICTELRAQWNPTKYVSMSFSSLPTQRHAQVLVHTCAHMHACTHTPHTHTHAHTHTHTHTRTHARMHARTHTHRETNRWSTLTITHLGSHCKAKYFYILIHCHSCPALSLHACSGLFPPLPSAGEGCTHFCFVAHCRGGDGGREGLCPEWSLWSGSSSSVLLYVHRDHQDY